ncbi:MAG: enoyl-CoA hydratase-related protein [Mycobacteriales bacterium]
MALSEEVQPVTVRSADGVAVVVLNRPDALNACTVELKAALLAALRSVATDDGVRAVVLTGAGRAFCAGQDLREHADALDAGNPEPLRTVAEHYNPIVRTIAEMPKPVIAAVNGVAAGAGASLALACDLRVAGAGAGFALSFAAVGLSLDSGASFFLPRVVGHGRAMAMSLLGETITADQALEMGLVNAVVDDAGVVEAALGLAMRLAAGPTAAYAAIKESIRFGATSSLGESLDREAAVQERVGRTEDHRTAVRAFLAKERPVFIGR